MRLEDVLEFLDLCEQLDVPIWIDGGWGVDSLLGKQTREHDDLDVAMHDSDKAKILKALEGKGFGKLDKPDTTEYNFVYADAAGHEIDFHFFELNEDGSNKLGVEFAAEHLTGTGRISDKTVKTIDPNWMVTFHTWYEPDADDYHDVSLLCQKFSIPVPQIYKKFETE